MGPVRSSWGPVKHKPAALLESVFFLDYASGPEHGAPRNELVLLIRGEAVFGSDQHGGVYAGVIAWRQSPGRHWGFSARVTCEAPRTAELIGGVQTSRDGAPIPAIVSGTLDPTLTRQVTMIEINGVRIEAAITALGPCQAFARGPSRSHDQIP